MARGRQPPQDAHQRLQPNPPKAPKPAKPPKPGQPPSFGGDPRLDLPPLVAPQRTPQQQREVIRRQMLLRNLGYKIVADGVWGPRSQRAWKDYLQRQRSGDLKASPYKRENGSGLRAIPQDPFTRERTPKGATAAVTQAEVRAEALKRQEALRRERQRVVAERRAAVVERAALLKRNPDAVRKMTIRQVSSALVETNLGKTPEGVRVLQTWLSSRGYSVKVTGSYDKATHSALEAAIRHREALDRKLRVDAISSELYVNAGVKPGDHPKWFPLASGIPTPKKLDELLQQGGMTAELVMNALINRWQMKAPIFDQLREAKLIELAASLNPMVQLAVNMGLPVNMLWAYGSILNANDLVPFPDLTKLPPGVTREEALAARARNEEVRQKNAAAVLRLRAGATALLLAKDEKDYQARAAALLKKSEDEFLAFQQKMASEELPWWGKAINAVLWPGEMFRQAYVYGAINTPKPLRGLWSPLLINVEEGDKSWDAAEQAIDELPMASRLTFELVADPLNLVAPLRIASTAVRFGTRFGTEAASLGTYRLVKGGRIWDTALRYDKGTWSKFGVLDKSVSMVVRETAFEPAVEALMEKALKFTQLKEVAITRANNRVLVQMRHLFKKPADAAARKSWQGGKGLKPELQKRIDEAATGVEAWIETSPELRTLLTAATMDKVSLYLDSGYQTMSNVGAALAANLTEKARVALVHSMATREVRGLRAALVDEAGGAIDDVARLNDQLSATYRNFVDRAATYLVGGHGDKELSNLIRDYTLAEMDDIENILLPSLQRVIERRLAKEGVSLWDEGGLWIGRTGEAAETVRVLGRETFRDDALPENIPNPAHGVPHTYDEFLDAVEFEVRRGLPRIYSYQARNLAAGTLPEGWTADAAADELRTKITSSWRRHSDGFYYDERPTLEVSALYARQHISAFRVLTERADELRRGQGEFVDDLAVFPFRAKGGELDDSLWDFMWMKGSRFGHTPGVDHPTRFVYGPDLRGMTPEAAEMARNRQAIRTASLTNALKESREALAAGADALLPRELAREGAYMQALARAQSFHFKALYVALYGSMAVWRFLTLPLRLGWVVRNTADNTAKAILRAVRDPRYLFAGAAQPGQLSRSIFANNIAAVRQSVIFLDRLFGTEATTHFDRITAQFWSLHESAINKVLGAHGVMPVPEIALRDARMTLMENGLRVGRRTFFRQVEDVPVQQRGRLAQLSKDVSKRIADTPDLIWDMMAVRPESYFKRVIYRAEYDRVSKRLAENELYLKSVTRELPLETAVEVPVFHGTTAVFESFDPALLDSEEALLYGKGFYFTESPELASQYAEAVRGGVKAADRGTPNVRLHRLAVKKPLDLDLRLSELSEAERAALVHGVEKYADNIEWGWEGTKFERPTRKEMVAAVQDMLRHPDWADTPLRELVDGKALSDFVYEGLARGPSMGGVEVTSKLWQSVFRDLDYDGYTHVGGHIMGDVKHRVWIAWDEKQIHPVWGRGQVTETVVDDTAVALAAHRSAWDQVVHTLFDYSQVTVIEDNFKVFFPFIQFWRKNLGFWANELLEKPWLPLSIIKLDQARQEAHADLPKWLQRYVSADEIVDAAAVVPGLDVVVDAMLPDDAMIDPVSMTSFAPLYRAYRSLAYGDNALLPGDKAGVAIIGPMIDAMNDFGLSMNPLIRKPLEMAGIASQRSWQRIFPQTPLWEAFSREKLNGLGADWPAAFEHLLGGANSDAIAENFDFYVEQEMVGQVARGEEPNRAKAEDTIRAWFLIQNVWGYFGGLYWRRATPEDIYLSKLSIADYDDLTDKEKSLRRLWSMRGMDRMTFDRYLVMLPLVQSYYAIEDWEERSKLLEKYPELRRYVSPQYTGRVFTGEWVKNARRYAETQRFFHALKVVDEVDPAPDVRDAALDMFTTPELRAWWAKNDTPEQIRQRQIKGEVQRYFRDLNRDYFSIPETDFEARNSYVQQHPELLNYWNRNNDPVDDLEAINHTLNAALREQYFALIEEKGFDGAAFLLKRHPFMFEDTKSANKVNEETGTWKIGVGKNWSAERIKDFREAKPHLTWFFDTFLPKVGKKKAFAWLYDSKGDVAKAIREYMDKYPSERRQAWMQAAPWLKIYFGLPADEKAKWLAGPSEGAAIVRTYFETYGKRGISRHALDYLDAKDELKFYFSLPKEKRSDWLNGDDPRAKKVLAYFKKYGREHAYERLIKKYPNLAHGTPEQRKRMEFWRGFFALSPDKRPEYVIDQAEAHGVFIYGEFGETERHDAEMEYMRRAVGTGASERQAAYLYVRPLLKFYRTLSPEEKPLFLRANPELQEYFDKYSKKSVTGDKKLDALVEQYFDLPADSPARSVFLRKHPQVQDWFDKRSSPAERAVRNALEQYFGLGTAWERQDFLLDHPEIQAYFERRREEKAMESSIARAFDHADPRLKPFYETASDLERAAQRMREKLAQRAYKEAGSIMVRRERRAA